MTSPSSLTQAQKQTIADWLAQGASVAELQNKLQEAFQLSLTYMQVKFLIDDLGLNLQAPAATSAPEPESEEGSPNAMSPADGSPPASGQVSLTIQPITRPGMLLSGTVTFSDGIKANWQVDNFGRLAIIPDQKGYQPSPADLQTFQVQLQQQVANKGY